MRWTVFVLLSSPLLSSVGLVGCFTPDDTGSSATETTEGGTTTSPGTATSGGNSTGSLPTTGAPTSDDPTTAPDTDDSTGDSTGVGSDSTGAGSDSTEAGSDSTGDTRGCTMLVQDDFERPDSDDIGSALVPNLAWGFATGSARILDGELTQQVDGNPLYLTLPQGETYSLANLRIRMKSRRNHSGPSVVVGINGDAFDYPPAPEIYPGMGLGNAGLLYFDGNPESAEDSIEGYAPDTDYYLEMIIVDGMATTTAATDNYASEGGTLVSTITPQLVSRTSLTTFRLALDDNGTPAVGASVDEFSVEDCS